MQVCSKNDLIARLTKNTNIDGDNLDIMRLLQTT